MVNNTDVMYTNSHGVEGWSSVIMPLPMILYDDSRLPMIKNICAAIYY
jgi:hypothetical protein